MRDYSKIAPSFWTGETGRMIRRLGNNEQLLALFLLSSPNANMIGLYHLPLAMITHYLGWDEEGALEGLARLSEVGFSYYDEVAEQVWIPEMAAHQIGEQLDKKDKRVKGIAKEWNNHRKSKFYKAFHDRYKDPFHLPPIPICEQKASPLEAPSKPLPSHEQEQEQDIPPLPPKGGNRGRAIDALDPLFDRFWQAYPNKVCKIEARRLWDTLNVDEPLLAAMLRAINHQKRSDQWQRGKIPKPSNWLDRQQWEDEGIRLEEPQRSARELALELKRERESLEAERREIEEERKRNPVIPLAERFKKSIALRESGRG